MKTTKPTKSIQIIGRLWFDKVNGNTYCSSRVYFDGIEVLRVPWEYGYGSYYIQKATEELKKLKLIKPKEFEAMWQYCERKKLVYMTESSHGLKRDMIKWGAQ